MNPQKAHEVNIRNQSFIDQKSKDNVMHMRHLVLYHTEEQLAKWKIKRSLLKFLIGESSFREVIMTIPTARHALQESEGVRTDNAFETQF